MHNTKLKKHYRRRFRAKLLLDECIADPSNYKNTNNLHDTKHITKDFKQKGITDPEVYKFAIKTNRILITFNIKDFRYLVKNTTPSVISLSMGLGNKSADLKICKLLKTIKTSDQSGKVWSITASETKILNLSSL